MALTKTKWKSFSYHQVSVRFIAGIAHCTPIKWKHVIHSKMLLQNLPAGEGLVAHSAAMATSSDDGVAHDVHAERVGLVPADLADRAVAQEIAVQRIGPGQISVVPHVDHKIGRFPELGEAAQADEESAVVLVSPAIWDDADVHFASGDVHVRCTSQRRKSSRKMMEK